MKKWLKEWGWTALLSGVCLLQTGLLMSDGHDFVATSGWLFLALLWPIEEWYSKHYYKAAREKEEIGHLRYLVRMWSEHYHACEKEKWKLENHLKELIEGTKEKEAHKE